MGRPHFFLIRFETFSSIFPDDFYHKFRKHGHCLHRILLEVQEGVILLYSSLEIHLAAMDLQGYL